MADRETSTSQWSEVGQQGAPRSARVFEAHDDAIDAGSRADTPGTPLRWEAARPFREVDTHVGAVRVESDGFSGSTNVFDLPAAGAP